MDIQQYIDTLPTYVNTLEYHAVMSALTNFFNTEGYVEACTQNRFSICTACEDVKSVATHKYCDKIWPLIQTGQMWLEWEILTNPKLSKGVYCKTTSYREEKNPIPGRHYVSFPLFEFETLGSFIDLLNLLTKLLIFLGYSNPIHLEYDDVANKYNTKEILHEHELMMYEEYGNVCFLKHFPLHTNPFWNMKIDEEHGVAKKVDVIMSGMETIGCAERSCDNDVMRATFFSLCDGDYHKLFFEKFGEDRTMAELDAFLKLEKKQRFGAGIGVTRLISSLKKEGLMDHLIEKYCYCSR